MFAVIHSPRLSALLMMEAPSSYSEKAKIEAADYSEMVEEVREGKPGADERLMTALYPMVIRIIRGRVPRQLDEEDLAQEAFIKVFRNINQYAGKAPFQHWVAKVTVNVCLNAMRGQRLYREMRVIDLAPHEVNQLCRVAAEGRDPAESLAERDLLAKLLSALSPEERLAVEFLDLEGYSAKEAAALLGVNVITVRVRASRARARLREMINGFLNQYQA